MLERIACGSKKIWGGGGSNESLWFGSKEIVLTHVGWFSGMLFFDPLSISMLVTQIPRIATLLIS